MILVTGAGGFIGGTLAVGLAAAGHKVVACDLGFDAPARRRLKGVACIEGTIAESFDLFSKAGTGTPCLSDAARPLSVIHAAALSATPEEAALTRAAHLRANTDALTCALDRAADLAVAAGEARFVFLSSSGVFSPDDGPGPHADGIPGSAVDPYSAAKRAGEVLTMSAAAPGFATLSVRLGPLYGPGEIMRPTRPRLSLVARMWAEASAGGPITVATPDARRDWTHAPDLVEAMAALLNHRGEEPAVANLTSGAVVSDLELAHAVAACHRGVRVADAGQGARVKGPLASGRHPALAGMEWTPLARGLAGLRPAVPA